MYMVRPAFDTHGPRVMNRRVARCLGRYEHLTNRKKRRSQCWCICRRSLFRVDDDHESRKEAVGQFLLRCQRFHSKALIGTATIPYHSSMLPLRMLNFRVCRAASRKDQHRPHPFWRLLEQTPLTAVNVLKGSQRAQHTQVCALSTRVHSSVNFGHREHLIITQMRTRLSDISSTDSSFAPLSHV